MLAFVKTHVLVTTITIFTLKIAPGLQTGTVPSLSSSPEVIFEEDIAHSGNHSAACHPRISQNKAAFHDVLKLMSSSKTNVIDLHVWIESENSTINNTQVFRGIKWANEIGRTLIWLIASIDESKWIISHVFKSTLIAGMHSVNVRMLVTEETRQCFLEKNKTLDQAIFHLFMHQLYHITRNSTSYQLCRLLNDKNYNCCTIEGKHDVLICSEYSSIVTEFLPILAPSLAFFLLNIGSPIILYYFNRRQKANTHYKISHSPMSLLSVAYMVFIEGKGPIKSFLRKCVFAFFVLVTTLNSSVISYSLLGLWAFIFIFFDTSSFGEIVTDSEITILTMTFRSPFEIIALPFNIKMWSRKFNQPMRRSTYALVQANSDVRDENHENRNHYDPLQMIKYRFVTLLLLVLYFTALPFLCLFALILMPLYCVKSLKLKYRPAGRWIYLFKLTFNSLTFSVLVVSMQNSFVLMFYFIVGLIFNGEIYSPYYVPLSTILFYAWVNWRSSVEEKYLLLATSIYEVCKEPIDNKMSENADNEITENNDADSMSESTTTPGNLFKIKLDEDGVPTIPKELYDLVREKFLPYDRVLFFYFQGVFFVVIFAYILFIVMSLAQTSGISNSVQITGTIAATSLPFIFDLVWEKNSDVQRAAKNIVLKSRLRRVLLVHGSGRVTGEIDVDYIGDN